jgi:hypothetical protein
MRETHNGLILLDVVNKYGAISAAKGKDIHSR